MEQCRPSTSQSASGSLDNVSGCWDSLPAVIQSEVLARVPVLDLLRLKLVSKSFQDLISDHSFASAQLSHSSAFKTQQFILLMMSSDMFKNGLSSIYPGWQLEHHHVAWDMHGDLLAMRHHKKLKFDFLKVENKSYICPSCNGLILVVDMTTVCGHPHPYILSICNPITRSYLRKCAFSMPCPGIWPFDVAGSSWSLGYDDVAQRYKVAMIRSYEIAGGCRRYEAVVSAFGGCSCECDCLDCDCDPWDVLEFRSNYSLIACNVAVRRKFIWLVFSRSTSKSDKDYDRDWQYDPGLIWFDMARRNQDAAAQEVMNLGGGGVLPKLSNMAGARATAGLATFFKVYEANGSLCYLGLSKCTIYSTSFEIWETRDWDCMSQWSRIHVVSVHQGLLALMPTWIMALEIIGEARRTDHCCISDRHDRSRECCRRPHDWMSSLEPISRYHCSNTVIHRDSLINLRTTTTTTK